ncbi:RNA polymerase sigma factor [soil metagenome]
MNEAEFIQALKKKNENAFRILLDEYQQKVYNTVLNIVQDEDEADDGAQEVFIKIYENISSFKNDSKLSTWIYSIAVRYAIDMVRKRKTKQKLLSWLSFSSERERTKTDSVFYHPGVKIENKEKAAELFKALEKLPERQKAAFTLIRIQGLTYEETSQIMQQSVKAIESLLSRAKENLQKHLQHVKNER